MPLSSFDIVILGAGAAGLMCAAIAGQRGRRVLLLDHAQEPGRKILISGGGRCNFTNLHTAPDRFFSANPDFCKSALARYTPRHFLALVEKHRILWHEKTLGQLFCDGSARQIVAMLLVECEAAGVTLRTGQQIGEITRSDRFHIETTAGPVAAASLILATGGLSIPKLGATDLAHAIARRFALPLTAIRPGLVPLTLPPDLLATTQPLSGVALPVIARTNGKQFAEAMLFTHRGLSGPAILQASSAWRETHPLDLDLLPTHPAGALLAAKRARPRATLRSVMADLVPHRLADLLLPLDLAPHKLADLPDRPLRDLDAKLKRYTVHPAGTEGYPKAEVTLGGIDTAALSSQSMQSRTVPGLFAIGEAVDVTGWLGGYNFQWAWASAAAAGGAA